MSQTSRCRMDPWGIIGCLIVTVMLRTLVIWSHRDDLLNDRDGYLGIAQSVVEGRGFCHPGSPQPTAFRPPLYPLLLAGAMAVLPATIAVVVINHLAAVITVLATWRIGKSLGLGHASMLAALLVAIDPLLLGYSAQPMTEAVCACLVSMFLFWTVRRDRPLNARLFVVGVLFGLLVLCRPTFWPLPGLMLMGWCVWKIAHLRHPPNQESQARRWPLLPWSLIAGTLLIVAPWVIRNAVYIGSPILTTTHGGYTLLLANNPVFYADVVDHGWGTEWPKASFDSWQAELQERLNKQAGPNASEIARDKLQNQWAREWIRHNPEQFLRSAWYRIQSLWSTVPQKEATAGVRSWMILAVGWYYTFVLLAFVSGMFMIAVRRRIREWWPLYAMIITIQLVHLAYWTNARMRAPLVPVISMFAIVPLTRRTL